MSAPNQNLLTNLIKLSKTDAALAKIELEKKRLDNEHKEKVAQLRKLEADTLAKTKAFEDRKLKYQKEEKSLRDDNQKLVDRRKALSTLSTYKLQQAGGREIENAAHELTAKEETLLAILDELDKSEKEMKSLQENFAKRKEELEKFVKDARESIAAFEDRCARYKEERKEYLPAVDPKSLTLYERIRDKFPLDTIIAIKSGSCSGCFMHVQPQVYVSIAKGDTLVRCPGCGRILYKEEVEQAA